MNSTFIKIDRLSGGALYRLRTTAVVCAALEAQYRPRMRMQKAAE